MPASPEEISALVAQSRPRPLRRHGSSEYSVHVSVGVSYCCAMFMAVFPTVYCPCGRFPMWLAPLSLTGLALAIGFSVVGLLTASSLLGRVAYVILLFAAPAAYL